MYNSHFIKKALSLRSSLSISKLAAKFNISTRTIQNWEQGKLPTGKRDKPNKTLDKSALIADVMGHPDSYQHERAERLGVSQMCIWHNLKKLGITYKKTLLHPKADKEKRLLFQQRIKEYQANNLDICYLLK